MIKVAISGHIASGKSTVGEYIAKQGFPVYDTDEMAHEILNNSEIIRELFKDFDVFTRDKFDRKKLAKVVFADKSKLSQLENAIHPVIKTKLNNLFLKKTDKAVFILIPQLFEAGFEEMFDKIIFVTADENTRIQRLMSRNNLTMEEAKIRINAQENESEKIKKSDFIIENNGDLNTLEAETANILKSILQA